MGRRLRHRARRQGRPRRRSRERPEGPVHRPQLDYRGRVPGPVARRPRGRGKTQDPAGLPPPDQSSCPAAHRRPAAPGHHSGPYHEALPRAGHQRRPGQPGPVPSHCRVRPRRAAQGIPRRRGRRPDPSVQPGRAGQTAPPSPLRAGAGMDARPAPGLSQHRQATPAVRLLPSRRVHRSSARPSYSTSAGRTSTWTSPRFASRARSPSSRASASRERPRAADPEPSASTPAPCKYSETTASARPGTG